jgi:hypothetical protein
MNWSQEVLADFMKEAEDITKQSVLRLPLSVHRKLKASSAERGISMQDAILEAVAAYLQMEPKPLPEDGIAPKDLEMVKRALSCPYPDVVRLLRDNIRAADEMRAIRESREQR